MEPDKIMESITNELSTALKTMANVKTSEEKLKYSQIVKNLCDSLGVFIDMVSTMGSFDDEEGESNPF
jgi:hypothetical protein